MLEAEFHKTARSMLRLCSNKLISGYGANSIRAFITENEAYYTIPPQHNVSEPWTVDWHRYKEHHLVEYFFQKIKWFRRVAIRCDKFDASFLACTYLAAIAILFI